MSISIERPDQSPLAPQETIFQKGEIASHWEAGGKSECHICLSQWEQDDTKEGEMCLRCNHIYHTQCIEPWLALHSTCPSCRSRVKGLTSQPTSPMVLPTSSMVQEMQFGNSVRIGVVLFPAAIFIAVVLAVFLVTFISHSSTRGRG